VGRSLVWQLLDPTAHIMLDINKNRTGVHYDPFGIVSRVLAHPKWGQVRAHSAFTLPRVSDTGLSHSREENGRAFPEASASLYLSTAACPIATHGGQHLTPLPCPDFGQLEVAHLVTWAELEAASAPVYRQSYSILLDQDLTHPFDTHRKPRALTPPVMAVPTVSGDDNRLLTLV
jgi:hypothetical protein